MARSSFMAHGRQGGVTPLLDGLCSRAGLLYGGPTARRVKQPDADRRHQRHHNDHAEKQSGDIGRTELSDTWHSATIISSNNLSGRAEGQIMPERNSQPRRWLKGNS